MSKRTQKNKRTSKILLVALIVLAIGYAIWRIWGTGTKMVDPKQSPTPLVSTKQDSAAPNPVVEKVTSGITITTDNSQFGTMLFNDKRQAIYIWQREESSKPECYNDCANAWPPVLTDGAPRAAGEVRSELLGTTKRSDGSTQVTYNGHPLYYYAHEGPGEVECHNITTHGGLWWVIKPSGIRAD